jgi:hypothetical protein
MTDYIRPMLRMFILFALIFTAFVVAKPKAAMAANLDCCQNCENRAEACLSNCTTGTPLQISACMSECRIQNGRCFEGCPACE